MKQEIKLTPELINQIIEETAPDQIIKAYYQLIEDETNYGIEQYFYHENLNLINHDLKVDLLSNYKPAQVDINLKPEYNLLLNELAGDAFYYFNIDLKFYYQEEEEALDFLCYSILQETIEGTKYTDEIKTEITTKEILQLINLQDKNLKKIIYNSCSNTSELIQDIQEAYKNVINYLLQEIQEELQNKYLNLYYLERENIEQYIIEQAYNNPETITIQGA